MKKKIFWVLSLVLICASCLFACSPISLSGGPQYYDGVYGNGGSAVIKGDYLYFTNAYKDYEELKTGENEYDKDKNFIYGIYRVKLNSHGVVDIDEKGNPRGAELLMPLVCGYSKVGLYIFGDYLYYSTPYSVSKSGQNEISKGYLKFEKVTLDGKKRTNLSKDNYTTKCEYNVNFLNDNSYLTILENETLTVIRSKGENFKEYKIRDSVTSMATFEQKDIEYVTKMKDGREVKELKEIDEVNKYIYYTRKIEDKYYLYRNSFDNENETALISASEEEIKLVSVKNNRVYYKIGNKLYSSTNTFLENDKKLYTNLDISSDATSGIVSFIILDDTYGSASLDRGILVVNHNDSEYTVSILKGNGQSTNETSFDKSKQINLVFTKNDCVFYTLEGDEEKALYCYNITKKEHSVVVTNFADSVDDKGKTFDFDGERVFFFGKVENSNQNLNYLQMALLKDNVYKNENKKSVANYIGLLEAGDIKKEEA